MKVEANNRHVSGFSLIEVTIALAITAVAMVSLMGMIPQGLKTMRDAADQAIEARMHQQLLGEMQLTPFSGRPGEPSPLDDFHLQERYYDDQGIELLDSQRGDFEHVYTARIHLPTSSNGGQLPPSVGSSSHDGVTIPGGVVDNEYMRLVVIEITAIPYDGGIQWENTANRYRIHTFQTFLAKMGQDFQP